MNAKYLLRVGAAAEFQHRYGRGDFVVFRKTLGSVVTYIVAREILPTDLGPQPIPTSVLREFDTQAEAIAALDRWATARRDPPLLKPRKSAVELCRNPGLPSRGRSGPGQMDLAF